MPISPTPTAAFLAANRYLGWGEPRHGLWFVGLEEASTWSDRSEEEVVRLYAALGEVSPAGSQIDFEALGAEGRRIRHTISRISSVVSASAAQQPDPERWRWYHDNKLWRVGSRGFQANLYPLGKSSFDEWPALFEKLFGFGSADREAYRQFVASTRFLRIRARWLEDRPLATVCFGISGWQDFKAVFPLTTPTRTLAGGQIEVFDQERVVLTPFFRANLVTNEAARAVGTLLRAWGVEVP